MISGSFRTPLNTCSRLKPSGWAHLRPTSRRAIALPEHNYLIRNYERAGSLSLTTRRSKKSTHRLWISGVIANNANVGKIMRINGSTVGRTFYFFAGFANIIAASGAAAFSSRRRGAAFFRGRRSGYFSWRSNWSFRNPRGFRRRRQDVSRLFSSARQISEQKISANGA